MSDDEKTPPSHPQMSAPKTSGDNLKFQFSGSSKTLRKLIAGVLAGVVFPGLSGYVGHRGGAAEGEAKLESVKTDHQKQLDTLQAKLDALQAEHTKEDHDLQQQIFELDKQIAMHLASIDTQIGYLSRAVDKASDK